MKTASKVLNVALNVLLWLVVIIAAFFSIVTFSAKSETGVASIGGYTPMSVLTDSMRPEFGQNDLIVVKAVDAAQLQEGDIIAYWTLIENQRAINTHRIIEKHDENGMIQFMTKGDANELPDNLIVSQGDIIGEYCFKIPVMGQILNILSSSTGFLVIIVLPLLLFFIWQLYKLILLIIEMKKEAVREAGEASRQQIEEEVRKKLEAERENGSREAGEPEDRSKDRPAEAQAGADAAVPAAAKAAAARAAAARAAAQRGAAHTSEKSGESGKEE
ncbi:signal peptidase I [Bacilliculturomica massiliensis]|uniref:signal peptidase I n=1 Tax=Bacilliculturomica massiliensis TaxID=1917867 RepID=UPI0010310C01|nr:signal peptidase I [Bacilliculturomica massiliensis]